MDGGDSRLVFLLDGHVYREVDKMASGKYAVKLVMVKPNGQEGMVVEYKDLDYEDVVVLEKAITPALLALADKGK